VDGSPVQAATDNWRLYQSRPEGSHSRYCNVTLDFSRLGKPTDNGFIEAFNSKLRAECLNAHRFLTLAGSHEKLENWRRSYKGERPHAAIGCRPPILLHAPGGDTSQPS